MRRYLLAAVAAVAISSPALARDGSPYIGIEGGLVIDGDLDLDLDVDYDGSSYDFDDAFDVDFKRGLDLDVIAGYDFGMFRIEGELGYKKLRADKIRFGDDFAEYVDDFGNLDDAFDLDGSGSVLSLMANGLFDFGDDSGWNGYVGGGIGRARVKFEGDRESSFAWQFIAGARKAISPTIDLGLKYRYFRTGKLEFSDEIQPPQYDVFGLGTDGKLRTHSLLASLIFNFAPPPPPPPPPVIAPPPPPPPPATQTCPDGSVILATDMCPPPPEPYVPPPPPPAEPERG